MALSLNDAESDRLARAAAKLTGESLTEAVRRALAKHLERERGKRGETTGFTGPNRAVGVGVFLLPQARLLLTGTRRQEHFLL